MLFHKFDDSGCSIFDGHSQFLSDMDINGFSGGIQIQIQGPTG
tara:strand:+ start:634 stop:762 length:129 start_codon:yes stop_codon:yes gene_type:complete